MLIERLAGTGYADGFVYVVGEAISNYGRLYLCLYGGYVMLDD